MPKLRVHNFTVSLDGYAAGRAQDLDHPLGVGGQRLHDWAFATRTFHAMLGQKVRRYASKRSSELLKPACASAVVIPSWTLVW